MTEGEKGQGVSPSRPLFIVAVVIAAWAVAVVFYASTFPDGEGVLAGGALFGVGCLIAGMGYLSMLRRSAMRKRESSMKKLLEKRRQERERES
jgi:hypothetical protein